MDALIVDDSKAMRMIVKRCLRDAEIDLDEVVEAEDGDDALEKLDDFSPDIIFSDWHMPNRTGIDFLIELRRRGDTTTFVFVTSEATPEIQAKIDAEGAQALISKPFTAEAFEETLEGLGFA